MRGPKLTFWATVIHSKSAPCWNTTPRSLWGPVTSWPLRSAWPLGRRQEAADDVEQRGLAAARGAEHGHQLAFGLRCSEMSSRAWTSPPFGKVKTIETLSMTSPSNAPSPILVRNDRTLTAARRLCHGRAARPLPMAMRPGLPATRCSLPPHGRLGEAGSDRAADGCGSKAGVRWTYGPPGLTGSCRRWRSRSCPARSRAGPAARRSPPRSLVKACTVPPIQASDFWSAADGKENMPSMSCVAARSMPAALEISLHERGRILRCRPRSPGRSPP